MKPQNEHDNYQNMLIDSYMQSGRIKQHFDSELYNHNGSKFLKFLSHLSFWSIIITGIYFIFW